MTQETKVRVQATIDAFEAAEFANLARSWLAFNTSICLDCSRLERIDAAGLQILLALQRELTLSGQELRLEAVPAQAAQYLEQAGASILFCSPVEPAAALPA